PRPGAVDMKGSYSHTGESRDARPLRQLRAFCGPDEFQMPKLEPQPQPAAALGFSTLNAAPPSDSTKSTVLPATRSRLTGSTTSFTPSVSLTTSSASGWSARSNLYWKPEHPPPSTVRRRIGGRPCLLAMAPTRLAAASVSMRPCDISPM